MPMWQPVAAILGWQSRFSEETMVHVQVVCTVVCGLMLLTVLPIVAARHVLREELVTGLKRQD